MTRESDPPATKEVVRAPIWAVGMIATNLLAGAGALFATASWKGTIETELRETRVQFTRDISTLTRKIDQQDDLRDRLRATEVKLDETARRMTDIATEYRSRGESIDGRLARIENTVGARQR